jgi:hypothetical protein
MIDEALTNLNDSDIYVQSLDIDMLNESKFTHDKLQSDSDNERENDSDATIDYIVNLPAPRVPVHFNNLEDKSSNEDSNEDIPLSFFSRKKKVEERQRKRNVFQRNIGILRSSENLAANETVTVNDDINEITEGSVNETSI